MSSVIITVLFFSVKTQDLNSAGSDISLGFILSDPGKVLVLKLQMEPPAPVVVARSPKLPPYTTLKATL